jgi:hypothetical protein
MLAAATLTASSSLSWHYAGRGREAVNTGQLEPPAQKTTDQDNVNAILLEELLKKVSGHSTGAQRSYGIFMMRMIPSAYRRPF